jgi:protein-L-isoaspartate(D-aspartate) O-methyltransferase
MVALYVENQIGMRLVCSNGHRRPRMQATLESLDPPTARQLRERLVRELVAEGDAGTPAVVAALRAVPRHAFMPHVSLPLAYANRATPIGYEQTISQPAVVAVMTEALELTGHERVLEIGTGSGYQAAVLAMLSRQVFSIERIEALANEAAGRLSRLGYANVHVRCSDGFEGWPEQAPFDRIVLTAAPTELPHVLVGQLSHDGGVLVAPVGDPEMQAQSLVRVRKYDGEIEIEDLGGVAFVPMVKP